MGTEIAFVFPDTEVTLKMVSARSGQPVSWLEENGRYVPLLAFALFFSPPLRSLLFPRAIKSIGQNLFDIKPMVVSFKARKFRYHHSGPQEYVRG